MEMVVEDKNLVLEKVEIMLDQYEMDVENVRNMLFRCEENDAEGVQLYRRGNIIITDDFMFRVNILLKTFEKYYTPSSNSTYDTISSIKLEFGLRKSKDYFSILEGNERRIMDLNLLEEELVLCALLLKYRIIFSKIIKRQNERLNLRLDVYKVFIKNKTRTVRNRII